LANGGLFAGGRSVSFFATFGGSFALAASPSQAASVKPSSFAASSNAAHQSLGWVMFFRSFVMLRLLLSHTFFAAFSVDRQ
jgi:uncharacterized membrane protein